MVINNIIAMHGAMFMCSWILVCTISYSATCTSWRCLWKCVLYIAAVVFAVVAVAVLKFMTNPDLTNLTGKKLLCSASINTLRFKSVCVCVFV